jgi:hypothetical protein
MSTYVKIQDFDLAWDETSETFESTLVDLGLRFPNVFFRIERLTGSGGGWPTVNVILPESEIEDFLSGIGYDFEEIEYIKEEGVSPL